MQVHHGRGYVYAIEYHIVWCVKYRRKVLSECIEQRLRTLLITAAMENGVIIEEFNCDRDHVHLLVSATPHTNLTGLIKSMKGRSARTLFLEFPYLKKYLYGGHLWNPLYFIATVSENTEAQIRDYIRSQKEK